MPAKMETIHVNRTRPFVKRPDNLLTSTITPLTTTTSTDQIQELTLTDQAQENRAHRYNLRNNPPRTRTFDF
uniref:Uncharacterized protein n=1 Tax=Romanomermis culicivorax TaxID=13658 RepID=A0A915JZT1_ROMCU